MLYLFLRFWKRGRKISTLGVVPGGGLRVDRGELKVIHIIKNRVIENDFQFEFEWVEFSYLLRLNIQVSLHHALKTLKFTSYSNKLQGANGIMVK